jgi:hypothetical protein
MLPDSALKSMRVMFAAPCYISGVSMNYVASMFSLALDSTHVGLPSILHLHSESLITRGRNKIVIKFLLRSMVADTLSRMLFQLGREQFQLSSLCKRNSP